MKLLHIDTKAEIKTGQIVADFRGDRWVLEGFREPHKPSSSGFIYVRSLCERRLSREFYPSVINAFIGE